jgi:DNA-binding NarL/FixJ family response regulator
MPRGRGLKNSLNAALQARDNTRPLHTRRQASRHMSAHPLRVLIAEDNDDLRDLLVTLVSAEADMKCVGTVSDVDGVIASTAQHIADVLVLDLELQGRSSIDVLKAVRSAGHKISIIVFSGHAHPEMIRHTLAAGADAYVPKSGDFELLLDAIRDKRI